MTKLYRLLLLGAACLLLGVLIIPAFAQDGAGPGKGGIILDGTISDITSLNPLTCQDTNCADLTGLMFPVLVGVDPKTATYVKGAPQAMALDWSASADGKVYTFKLRSDYNWNDGTPVTAGDFVYSFNAIKSGKLTNDQYVFVLGAVDNMEAPDPQTLVVTYKESDCRAVAYANIPPLPAHVLPADFDALNTSDFNLSPTVTAGPFKFGELLPGEHTSVVADQTYKDASLGYVSPEAFIYKNVPDTTVRVEQFLAGEINFVDGPSVGSRADVRAAAAKGDVQVYDYPGNFWDYLAFNLADPKNPQNGTDDKGNPIDQGHHPVLGDKRVRQAIAKAVDMDAMIKAAVFGEGTRMSSVIIPGSWAYNSSLAPIQYDPEAAKKMLDDAGWMDKDGDGIRECHGCLYAQEGTKMSFTMTGNEGNTRRAAEGQLIQDELKQVGVDAQYQAVDFATWQEIANSQTFDAVMLAWQQGYPDDPDQTQLFTAPGDVVGSGSNYTSYNNPEFEKLNNEARTLPGCDTAARKKLYDQMQVVAQDDLPYLWMYTINGMYAAGSDVQGFAPYPGNKWWNLDTWVVKAKPG